MSGKSVTIDFGYVFPHDDKDRDALVRRIEKNVQLNVGSIVEDGAYKHSLPVTKNPMKLKVAIELAEG